MKRTTKSLLFVGLVATGMIMGAVNLVVASDLPGENDRYIEALKSENLGWKVSAAQILGDAREKNAVEPLIDLLKNEGNYAVKVAAIVALVKIGDARAIEPLRKVAEKDSDKTVRHIALAGHLMLKRDLNAYLSLQ